MTAEMIHVEGDNGPGWMVPKPKTWEEMTEVERIARLLSRFGISCPGWCVDHSWGNSPAGVSVILHSRDLGEPGEPFAGYLSQRDTVSFPDGDLVERDPVRLALIIDPDEAPELVAMVERHLVGDIDVGVWDVEVDEAVTVAEKLRGEPHEWTPRLAEVLTTLAAAVAQARRSNGRRLSYGRGFNL